MKPTELLRIKTELTEVGYSETSFRRLGADFDEEAADSLHKLSIDSSGSEAALQAVAHIDIKNMTIVQDERCMVLARQILQPAINILFAKSEEARKEWSLFGINRYEKGGKFGAHQDSTDATVLVVTLAGVRVFDVFKTDVPGLPDGTKFSEIENTFYLSVGSIMILDRLKDPAHAVKEVLEPSLTAVADVPFTLR